MINDYRSTGWKQQASDIDRQPEDGGYSGDEVIPWLWLEDEAIDEENDVGDVADKPSHVAELHKPVHLAHGTTERLVTSTKHWQSVFHDGLDVNTVHGDIWQRSESVTSTE